MVKIDEMDKLILKQLEIDARVSYRSIAKELGISVGTVHNRIAKLKKNGVLKGFLLDLDSKKLGFNLRSIIMISTEGKYTSDVLEKLSGYPEIIAIYHITGEYSASLICRFQDIEANHDFITKLNQEPHVTKTISYVVFQVYKEDEHHLLSDLDNRSKDEELESEQNSYEHTTQQLEHN
ncbi:MAG: Lrp/AsnC family transcriptional regulator [archaeon]|nr:Lrp/AsnC family transcriptional regulator [archaeon]